MPRFYKKVNHVASVPGTLHPVNDGGPTTIELIDYDEHTVEEKKLNSVEEVFHCRDTSRVSWINIVGRDVNIIQKVDDHFGIHPLVLEDIVNAGQRPKLEDYGDYLFFVLKMVYIDDKINDIYSEQISLVLGKNFLISFQEKDGDVFQSVRHRIRESLGRIRKLKGDYLMYALLDAIVDHYFVVLEQIGEKIDEIEAQVLKEPKQYMTHEIYKLKTKVIYLRKQIWPLREVLANFQRTDSKLITQSTQVYLRDVYDHTIQVNDTVEAFRDAVSGLHDIYLSSVSNKMNEIMKVLTIFAAIFIPLTFIAGIYGMNFDYIPELHFKYGYFVAIGIMFTLGVGMLLYFKSKKWI